MRLIIAGSRDITDMGILISALDNVLEWGIERVVSGCARGVDSLAIKWAEDRGITVDKHPANWDHHGKAAGYVRNKEMAYSADGLVAIWDGKSKGTKHMIDIALAQGLWVYVYRTDKAC